MQFLGEVLTVIAPCVRTGPLPGEKQFARESNAAGLAFDGGAFRSCILTMDYLVPCKTPAFPFRSISPPWFSWYGSREGMFFQAVPPPGLFPAGVIYIWFHLRPPALLRTHSESTGLRTPLPPRFKTWVSIMVVLTSRLKKNPPHSSPSLQVRGAADSSLRSE